MLTGLSVDTRARKANKSYNECGSKKKVIMSDYQVEVPKRGRTKRVLWRFFLQRSCYKGHSLSLSGPDGPDITIELLNCMAVAVSA
jgi:hypothetical protein